ncbi:TadE/TadG family type IV pilus assembly protein [Streptomyces sp. NPDC050433]|uniref:TadE/TadG family type IV pilus assembly protein n=1 Tax=unclassified Streptomyces TaxID=2593676 RepID=UPI00341C7A85
MMNRILRGTRPVRGDRRDRPDRRKRPDKGQAAIEFAGIIFILLIAALAAIQLGLAAYAVQQAGTASRTAARAASQYDNDWRDVGKSAVSDWLADGDGTSFETPDYGTDDVKITAVVEVPSILPLFTFDPAKRSTTMPMD